MGVPITFGSNTWIIDGSGFGQVNLPTALGANGAARLVGKFSPQPSSFSYSFLLLSQPPFEISGWCHPSLHRWFSGVVTPCDSATHPALG